GVTTGCSGGVMTNSSCGTPLAGTFKFQKYTFTNTGAATCYTVTLAGGAACTGAADFVSAAYSPSFNPATLCGAGSNYVGDLGLGPATGATSYSFGVPAGATFDVIVWNRTSTNFCPDPYDLTLTPCASVGGGPTTSATKLAFAQQPT